MKKTIFIILYTLLFLSTACNDKKSKHTVYWENNNLCVVMPHPTMGIVGFNQIDWRGVNLSEVLEDIYNEIMRVSQYENISIWVRFEIPEHDKYGNETMSYDDHQIAIIPISEGKKYKSGHYLNIGYGLTDGIHKAAFGDLSRR